MTAPEQQTDHLMYKVPGGDWHSLTAEDQAGDSKTQDERFQQVRAAKEELKNVLLSSLQMQHLVVLSGSGCSREAGGPSMGDLWNAAIGKEPSAKAKRIAERIHFSLEPVKLRNIEAFLSQAEAFLQVQNDECVRTFINECKKKILAECSEFLDTEKLGAHQTFLHRLSRRRVRDQRLKVFTTNYDLCFERAAAELGGVAMNGFSFMAPRGYDPRFFSYDIIRRPRSAGDLGNYLEGVFLLYKLHGSVNWARLEDGTIQEKSNPEPEEACLIYPATGKYQQSFLQPYLESISQYLAALREPNTCVLAVGFGFNDDHFSEPLLAAVQSNPHLRLIVVNPGSKDQDEKSDKANRYWQQFFDFGQKGEDIWFINAGFSAFAEMIPDLKALTPADNLMKAIQGVAKGK